MKPLKLVTTLSVFLALFCTTSVSFAQEEKKEAAATEESAEDESNKFLESLNWTKGPATANMESIAEIKVPEGFMFTGGDDTRKLMEAMGNLTSDTEIGFLAPTSMVWFVIFRFSEDGYVKDDDKDKLDPKAMIASIKEGTEEGNKERRKRGWATMKVIGWEKEPHYDATTQNLEWAVRGESEGEQVVNYNTRILGRKGVMEVKLICDPTELPSVLPEFKTLLTGYQYKQGQRYAEYREGDKVAKYGLAALVTGGAVAVAAKTGLLTGLILFLKKGWKIIIIGVVAVGAAIKNLIFGRDRRNSQ